jgi:Family of unknown function (DUF5681)
MQDPIPKTTRAESPEPRDYEVGYGRPPKETRFQPGKSGNPRGRPKVERPLGDALREELYRQIEVVNEMGVKRKVPALDLIMRGLVSDSTRRDRAALRQLLLFMRYADGGKPPDDRQQREAELAEAKEAMIAKLEAMSARVREMPGFVPLTLAPAEPS